MDRLCERDYYFACDYWSYIYNPMVRGPIFSFHMPLFFILSGMTYKWSKDIIEYKAKTLKTFWHLIIPAISIYVVTTVLLEKSDVFLKSNLLASVLTLFFSSGVKFSLPLFFGGGIS